MKKLSFLAAIILVLAFMVSCGASSNYDKEYTNSAPQADPAYDDSYGYASDTVRETVGGLEESGGVANLPQKIIKDAGLHIHVEEFDAAVSLAKNYALSAGGYIENFSASGTENKSGQLIIRVPSERFDDTLAAVRKLGEVTSAKQSEKNVSAEYYNISARLDTKLAEEARILQMIDAATNISDLITLEERLSDIRYSIRSYEASLTDIDLRAGFSTITLNLYEDRDVAVKVSEEGFFKAIADSFFASVNFLITLFKWIVIIVVAAALPGALMCSIASVVVLVIRLRRKRRKKR